MHPIAKRIRVLPVGDHEVVRVGLRTILSQDARLEVVGEVGTGADARSEVAPLRPHVILMDLWLPDGTGIEACREILEENHEIRILFLTSFPNDDSMLAAILAGASGYLLKEIGTDRLIQAIEIVAGGHSILDRNAMKNSVLGSRKRETTDFHKRLGVFSAALSSSSIGS